MDVTRRTALWATALQGLFALTWALYVAFLPALLAAAGIDARFAVFFLLFDQAVFALADWAAGLYADRLQRLLGRIGAHLIAAALVSSAALALLPFVARAGDPALLIAATALWTATSSALRAPVFALLGRAGGVLRPAGSVSVALIGIGIANALAPLLTRALAQVDPRLPLALAAAALAAAAAFAGRLEVRAAGAPTTMPRRMAPAAFVAALVFVAGFGTQLHTAVLGARAAAGNLAWAPLWAPTFWTGFAIGLGGAALLGRAPGAAVPLRAAARSVLVGAAALALAQAAASTAAFVAAQALAGAAWAVFMAIAFRAAMDYGGNRGAGSPVGLIFSALAAAALARLALTVAGLQAGDWVGVAASLAWLAVAVALLAFAPAR